MYCIGFLFLFTACGSDTILEASLSGTVQSPNYPGNYTDNAICSWVIKADDGYVVDLSFTAFDLEPYFDYLYVSVHFLYVGTYPKADCRTVLVFNDRKHIRDDVVMFIY